MIIKNECVCANYGDLLCVRGHLPALPTIEQCRNKAKIMLHVDYCYTNTSMAARQLPLTSQITHIKSD